LFPPCLGWPLEVGGRFLKKLMGNSVFKRFEKSSAILLAILLLPVIIGCGGTGGDVSGRSKVYPVEGTIFYKGVPIEGAIVVFHSEISELSASGLTNSEGKFRLQTYTDNDGAVSGPHKVTVKKIELKTVPNPVDENLGPISSEEIWHTPKKYSTVDSTPLTQIVADTPTNQFEIKLED
jgi:hypothetical protein